ncbi:unnamed protein product, partial [Pleuronectes platessa]
MASARNKRTQADKWYTCTGAFVRVSVLAPPVWAVVCSFDIRCDIVHGGTVVSSMRPCSIGWMRAIGEPALSDTEARQTDGEHHSFLYFATTPRSYLSDASGRVDVHDSHGQQASCLLATSASSVLITISQTTVPGSPQ